MAMKTSQSETPDSDRPLTPAQRLNAAITVLPSVQCTKRRKRKASEDQSPLETVNLAEIEAEPLTKQELIEKIGMILADGLEYVFEKSGLDFERDEDWKLLLVLLAWALFGNRHKRGAPLKWTLDEKRKLLNAYRKLKGSQPSLSDNRCAQLLHKQLRTKQSPGTLRKIIRIAKEIDELVS
ncbi:MAG: hypothetical protein WBW73_06885 [Rhodoplanes sp.]